MDQIGIYVVLWAISLVVGMAFIRTSLPIPLLLVITGTLLGFVPGAPYVEIQPTLVLNVFLPMLVYAASAIFSWKDVRLNIRPIALLSIGHVFFIAVVVAVAIHTVLPALGWPLAFVLGAIVAPPDDVATLAIADKVNFPSRVLTIIKGESLLNDATALVLFRFSLAAVFTHEFSVWEASSAFVMVVVGETAWGILVGNIMGKLRLRLKDTMLQMMASIITPFLAYIPAEAMGGCGILATVVTGFVVGHRYLERFPPEARLTGIAVWNTLSYALQSIIFLLVGLNLKHTLEGISTIPWTSLAEYSAIVILAVTVGRFVWVFLSVYLPHFLIPSICKKEPYPPWQQPFIVAWAGMRGVISLAAVLAIPMLPLQVEGVNPKDLFIFLTFTVIAATLIFQGLSLPWLIKKLGLHRFGLRERYKEHLSELGARLKIAKKVHHWLHDYEKTVKDNKFLMEKIHLRIKEYELRCKQLAVVLKDHDVMEIHEAKDEQQESGLLSSQINDLERAELLKLWHENKISHAVRTKLLSQLDHRYKHITG